MNRPLGFASAAVSGVLLCFSFPTVLFGWHAPHMGWLAWFALVPLFLAVRSAGPRRAFLLTFVAGLIAYAGSLYWVYRAMNTFGKLPPATSVLVLVLMVVILAAYIALAPMIARLIETRWRGEFIALIPACWVAVELARNYGPFGGFPWANIAMSQWRALGIIQIVDAVGVYGLIFLIVWVNACLAEFAARIAGEPVRQLTLKAAVTILLLVAAVVYGRVKIAEIGADQLSATRHLDVGIVQANIPQEEKWVEERALANLDAYRRATRNLRDSSVELIVWPEAAFPWPIDTRAVRMDPAALGFDTDELGPQPYVIMGAISTRPDGEYHNSMVLFDASGAILERFHKVHLVPFGEYVPYERLFFFARKLTEPVGRFRPGDLLLPMDVGGTSAGPLICYEDIFPEMTRALARAGAEYLVNVTNDAWYGVSSAPYQHLALAVFRSVESRRYMVRATNTGVSAIIAPTGEVLTHTGIFHDAVIVARIGLMSRISAYVKYGDWFAYACAAYAALGIAIVAIKKFSRRI